MPAIIHDILERARATGQRLTPQEAAVLFAAATRLAAAQGATLRGRLVQIDEHGALQLLAFDDHQPETELGYLAPELLQKDAPRKNEPRVQVFAAGALGYELFSGQPPGSGGQVTGPLAEIIRMAIAPDRRERFGGLNELLDAVEEVQKRLPLQQEQQALAALRQRAAKWGAEKEALAKLIGQLGQVERAQRQTMERLDRIEEGFRRGDEARKQKPSVALPAVIAGALAGAAVVGATWAAGMLGAAARPPVQPEAQALPAAPPPLAKPTPVEAPPPKPAPPPKVVPVPEPPDAAVADAGDDATVSDAGPADAGSAEAAPPLEPPAPPKPAPAKGLPKATPQISQRAMAHAVALSQVKRGDSSLERRRIDEALESYRTALENEPTLPEAFRGLGTAYTLQGNEKLALQNYERYLQLAPKAKDAADIRRAMAELKARARQGGAEEK